jgi:peptide/nickel transport system permease protein
VTENSRPGKAGTTKAGSKFDAPSPRRRRFRLPWRRRGSGATPLGTDADGNAEHGEDYYLASSAQLIWRSFKKHKLGVIGVIVLVAMYFVAAFAGFFGPYGAWERNSDAVLAPPTRIRIVHEGRLHAPFVYAYETGRDPVTLAQVYEVDKSTPYRVKLFVRGEPYDLLGFLPTDIRFFGVEDPGDIFLFGTDTLGRDVFSRVLQGARVSLSIGLIGVIISFILGAILGGVSGYFGGAVDMIIQRIIEFLNRIPSIPLWMALAAAVPTEWSPIVVYFMITVVLSILGWTGLARTVRGKILQLRTEDYVMAARFSGSSEWSIIRHHLLPGFMSYLIVHITLAIPGMILGETALSFIGVGLKAPVVSWGVMLQQAQNIRTVAVNPWLMLPGLFVVLTVLCFNFVGDGLRDSADPYA